jgi:hypothetical protein
MSGRFAESSRNAVSEPIREVLEPDESDVIHCWALDYSLESARCGSLNIALRRTAVAFVTRVTDAEWAIVAPMIPPGRHGGRQTVTGSSTCCGPAVSRALRFEALRAIPGPCWYRRERRQGSGTRTWRGHTHFTLSRRSPGSILVSFLSTF